VTAHTVEVRTIDGGASATVVLDESIFGIEPNVAVLHQVVTAQLAAARRGTQSTKTRAEVRGGGKKPFKQKGTGRARQGSIRAPHWAGGGVALGPKPRSYKQRTPRKMIQLALRSALSDRASEDRVMVMAEWPWTEGRTRNAREALEALGLAGSVLVVLDRSEDEPAYLAFRNLPDAQVLLSGELNAYDVLCNDWVVFTLGTLPGVTVAGPPLAEQPGADDRDTEAELEAEAIEDAGAVLDAETDLEAPAQGGTGPDPGTDTAPEADLDADATGTTETPQGDAPADATGAEAVTHDGTDAQGGAADEGERTDQP
jgi:large subunit ribosomal protein L4